MRHILNHHASLIALACSGSFALGACTPASKTSTADQVAVPEAAIPLSDSAPQPVAYAPPAERLPPAPVRYRRPVRADETWGYIDEADQLGYGFGDAPPDYAFDYDGTSPWAWRSNNGWYRVVEPVRGGERYYYYRPGSDRPFLVRDPDYAYGYDNGELVVVYDRGGRPLAEREAERRADLAGRYLSRAQALYRAAQQDRRRPVERSSWQTRRPTIQATQVELNRQRQQAPDWQAFRQRQAPDWQSRWAGERERREAEAARVARQSNDPQAEVRAVEEARKAREVRTAVQPIPQGPHGPPPPQPVAGPATLPPPAVQPSPGAGDLRHGPRDRGPQSDQAAAQAAHQQAVASAQASHQAQVQAAEQGRLKAQAQADAQAHAQAAQQAQVKAQQAEAAQTEAQTRAKRHADQAAAAQARANAAQAHAQAKVSPPAAVVAPTPKPQAVPAPNGPAPKGERKHKDHKTEGQPEKPQ